MKFFTIASALFAAALAVPAPTMHGIPEKWTVTPDKFNFTKYQDTYRIDFILENKDNLKIECQAKYPTIRSQSENTNLKPCNDPSYGFRLQRVTTSDEEFQLIVYNLVIDKVNPPYTANTFRPQWVDHGPNEYQMATLATPLPVYV